MSRRETAASLTQLVELQEAARQVGYSSEYLRKLMFGPEPRPPLRKRRGRWVADVEQLEAWADGRFPEESAGATA